MNETVIVKNLTKTYGNLTAVNKLNLTVRKGTVFGLLGANGAGKSTSIECILGTKKYDDGTVKILGYDPVKDRKKLFEKVGVQFQETNYQNEIKVKELCEETEALYEQISDYRELLSIFGIKEKMNELVKNLSGGEKQRLFIALSLIMKPKVVFLDELTTGLDVGARNEVWKTIIKLKDVGLTILLTSHFMDEVEAVCDEVCILNKGKTVYYGTVLEALNKSGCDKFEDAYLYFTKGNDNDENVL